MQNAPSSHEVPSARGAVVHCPVIASHTPRTQPCVSDEQSSGWPTQVPERQTSVMVQTDVSLQEVPSFVGVATH